MFYWGGVWFWPPPCAGNDGGGTREPGIPIGPLLGNRAGPTPGNPVGPTPTPGKPVELGKRADPAPGNAIWPVLCKPPCCP